MKIYKTNDDVIKDIKNGVLEIDGDVTFECSISIDASIKVNAGNITSMDITAINITAWDITAGNITAINITAGDINAGDITAMDITAGDINAMNITAWDILYYAFCGVYNSIKCLSIKAKRDKHSEPICLDGTLEIKKEAVVEEMTLESVCKLLGKTIKIIK